MQQFERAECRLWNSALGHEAITPVERLYDDTCLIEYIRKSPQGKHGGQAITFANIISEPWSHEGAIGYLGLSQVGRIVLGYDDRRLWSGGPAHLFVNLPNCRRDHIFAGCRRGVTKPVNGVFVAVDMSGNKVERDSRLRAMLNETIHPGGLRGGRASHPQSRIDCFDGRCSQVVESIISLFFRTPAPEIDIRFIPEFEIPVFHFTAAVPGKQVNDKSFDQFR